MTKIVRNNWEFKVERVNGKMLYSAHYTVESEGIEQKRGMIVEFSSAEETKIRNFIMSVVRPKVEEAESGN